MTSQNSVDWYNYREKDKEGRRFKMKETESRGRTPDCVRNELGSNLGQKTVCPD
jgi:hypothetical protein